MHAAVIFFLIPILTEGSRSESDSSIKEYLNFFQSFVGEPRSESPSPNIVEERNSLDSISLYEEIYLHSPARMKSTDSASPFLESSSPSYTNKRLFAGVSAFVIAAILAGVLMYLYL